MCCALVAAAFAVGGCRSARPARTSNPLMLRGTDTGQAPVAAPAAAPDRPAAAGAVVRPGFVLTLTVLVDGRKEIDESGARVSEDGDVRLPLVGPVQVAGLTLNTLREKVTNLYREYFVEPQVSVDFVADTQGGVSPWGTVTVLGRVKNPGNVPLPPTRDLSVVAAIQAAGGFDTSADQGGIRVTRNGPEGRESRRINLKALGTGGTTSGDLLLKDGDVVYIPELMF